GEGGEGQRAHFRYATRRAMRLAVILAVLFVASDARSMGEGDKLAFAQISYAGKWNPRPGALKRLAWEIEKRTSIATAAEPAVLRLSDDAALRRHPLLYLSGEGALPPVDDGEVTRLRKHLQAGGMLVIDGAEPRPGGAFDESVRALVKRLFPRQPLQRVSPEHVLYKS